MTGPTTIAEELNQYKVDMARIASSETSSVVMSAAAAGVIERIDNADPNTISNAELNWIASEAIRIKRDYTRLTPDA